MTLSVFANDNTNFPITPEVNPTTGLELFLTLPPTRETPPVLLSNVTDGADPLYSIAAGNYIPKLGNENRFLGYGFVAAMKEFGPDPEGRNVRWSATFGNSTSYSYRAFKQEWHATPCTVPDLTVKSTQGYVSWNGATDIDGWNIYEGSSDSSLELMASVNSTGFETSFNVTDQCVKACAVRNATEVGSSDVLCS